MVEKAPMPVSGFDCEKLPADLLDKFGETAANIQGDVLKLAGLLLIDRRCREIFERGTNLTLTQWAEQITKTAGVPPEIADK